MTLFAVYLLNVFVLRIQWTCSIRHHVKCFSMLDIRITCNKNFPYGQHIFCSFNLFFCFKMISSLIITKSSWCNEHFTPSLFFFMSQCTSVLVFSSLVIIQIDMLLFLLEISVWSLFVYVLGTSFLFLMMFSLLPLKL
jgi:hypothetical protein